MHLQPITDNLRFMRNQEWYSFYTILGRLEKTSKIHSTPYELIKALCNEFSPPYYESQNTHLHITEWEFRRIRVFHN